MSTDSVSETITETVPAVLAAIAAFQSFYLAELDNRVKRSEVVGAITLKKGSAALFYEPAECKFTLVEKMPDVEEANVWSSKNCVKREEWTRSICFITVRSQSRATHQSLSDCFH
jgi:hypothetical protein